ncbi:MULTISPECIES: MlaA family lipoprotein [unclassified Sphingomonas]|uniref:MlaA family lipoprotein n=1 Tax=unclassified Sphingomonas TaxID=196159 RepID=UPI0006F23A3A|nr:VacJ family lipoprotein [Sphingomonas sp. Leaf198]KQS51477.1 hypothetical protein ASG20_05535 [Sphingomonas sp. Leaf198]
MTPAIAALLLAGVSQAAPLPQRAPPPAQVGEAPAATPPAAAPRSRPRHARGDSLEGFNRRMFATQQGFDRRLFRPAAMGYKHVVPKPVRSGIRNVFSNLGEPIVFLNYLLQLKPGKAAETFGRFMFNSTLGIGGLVDVAKLPAIKLPHRPNGFGNTLALYGVKPGPYIFLPFVGPSTLRDLLGGQADGLVLPLAVGSPFDRLEYQAPRAVLTGLDTRAEADDDLRALFAGAVDPYATLRSVYLQNRVAEIQRLRGTRAKAAGGELGDPLADPASGATVPASDAPELSDPLADPAAMSSPTATPAPSAPDSAPELSDPLTDPAAPQADPRTQNPPSTPLP